MNAVAKIEQPRQRSVLVDMSERYGMEPTAFEATVRATVCKGNVSREEFAAFLLVAKEHRLNPLTKEIYAFPAKGGGIQPIVSIDGWARIINEHPAFDGMEFVDERDDGELVAITCRMFRKDRAHPIAATEYMKECVRATDVWRTWPRRMLRHKAMIQCARYAFGFSGIIDPDEYERVTAEPARPEVRRLHAGFDEVPENQRAIAQGAPAAEAEFTETSEADQANDTETSDAPDPGVGQGETGTTPRGSPPPPTQSGETLADRIAAFMGRVRAASTTVKMTSLWNASAALRNAVDAADPDEYGTSADLEQFWQARFDALEQEEREGAR